MQIFLAIVQTLELGAIAAMSFFIWRQFQQQREQISQQREQITQQGEQISQQRKQIMQQGEQVSQQREQIMQQNEQHRLDRLIAWKTSLHQINQLIMDKPKTFIPVLYPKAKTTEEAERRTAAYASLHALEVIYYMRKDEETSQSKRLDEFLTGYVAGKDFRELWALAAYRVAFTQEFQDKLNNIFNTS